MTRAIALVVALACTATYAQPLDTVEPVPEVPAIPDDVPIAAPVLGGSALVDLGEGLQLYSYDSGIFFNELGFKVLDEEFQRRARRVAALEVENGQLQQAVDRMTNEPRINGWVLGGAVLVVGALAFGAGLWVASR